MNGGRHAPVLGAALLAVLMALGSGAQAQTLPWPFAPEKQRASKPRPKAVPPKPASRPPTNTTPSQPAASAPLPKPAPNRQTVAPAPNLPPVPLPLPRPKEIAGPAASPPAEPAKPVAPEDSAPPPPPVSEEALAACLKAFAEKGGEAAERPEDEKLSAGEGACTVPGPVTFSRVKLEEGAVTLDSAITVRCTMALQLAEWVRDDLAPLAKRHGTTLTQLKGVGGTTCRARNGQVGGQISEHASGNAIDLLSLKLADGRLVELWKDDASTKEIREEVKKSVCARFRTVLGPGADAAHANHLHLDMRQRRNDFSLCQWEVK
ncbi:extensin family protein [Xanthobacteraceae bacterium A53D]